MPKFSIQLRTDSHVWDTVVVEREGMDSLRLEVAAFVGELLKEHAAKIWADEEWRIDVTDASGLILYYMQVAATKAPSTMGQHHSTPD